MKQELHELGPAPTAPCSLETKVCSRIYCFKVYCVVLITNIAIMWLSHTSSDQHRNEHISAHYSLHLSIHESLVYIKLMYACILWFCSGVSCTNTVCTTASSKDRHRNQQTIPACCCTCLFFDGQGIAFPLINACIAMHDYTRCIAF